MYWTSDEDISIDEAVSRARLTLTGLAWTESFLCISWGEGGGTGFVLIILIVVAALKESSSRDFDERVTDGVRKGGELPALLFLSYELL